MRKLALLLSCSAYWDCRFCLWAARRPTLPPKQFVDYLNALVAKDSPSCRRSPAPVGNRALCSTLIRFKRSDPPGWSELQDLRYKPAYFTG